MSDIMQIETRQADVGCTDMALTTYLTGGTMAVVDDKPLSRSAQVRRINRIGMRYGLLTVVAEGPPKSTPKGRHTTWVCRCECGKVTQGFETCNLPHKKSCGCLNTVNKYDFTGRRFGRLVVISRAPNCIYVGNVNKAWECQCDCGNVAVIAGISLRTGSTKSCGCYRRERGYLGIPDEASFNILFGSYSRQARKRDIEFSLTKEQFRSLSVSQCYYCGVVPSQQIGPNRRSKNTLSQPYIYNGVDRKDNSIGYTTGNCVAACGPCNVMKMTLSVEEFISTCHRVAAMHPTARPK